MPERSEDIKDSNWMFLTLAYIAFFSLPICAIIWYVLESIGFIRRV